MHVGAPEVRWLCTAFTLEPSHALASLAVNRCCLASRATGTGVSTDCLVSAPIGVMRRAHRVDLACRSIMS